MPRMAALPGLMLICQAALGWTEVAVAQVVPNTPAARSVEAQSQDEGLRDAGRTVDAGTGEVGQRQRREDVVSNIEPQRRLNTRIENRVQNRLRNRIDRDYDATANATAPFERATDRTREGVQQPR